MSSRGRKCRERYVHMHTAVYGKSFYFVPRGTAYLCQLSWIIHGNSMIPLFTYQHTRARVRDVCGWERCIVHWLFFLINFILPLCLGMYFNYAPETLSDAALHLMLCNFAKRSDNYIFSSFRIALFMWSLTFLKSYIINLLKWPFSS